MVKVQAMQILTPNSFYHLRFLFLPLSVSMFLLTQGLSQLLCKQRSVIFTKNTKWLKGLEYPCIESEKTSYRFQALWKVIIKVSTDIFVEPLRKRSGKRQQNRSNPPVIGTKNTIKFSFVDHTLSHLKTRLPPELEEATFLLPGNTAIFPTRQLLTSNANFLLTFLTNNRASKLRWVRGKTMQPRPNT